MQSIAKGKLPLNLPEKAQEAHKVEDLKIDLLSLGLTTDQKTVGVFKSKDMFISKEEDIKIILKIHHYLTK